MLQNFKSSFTDGKREVLDRLRFEIHNIKYKVPIVVPKAGSLASGNHTKNHTRWCRKELEMREE